MLTEEDIQSLQDTIRSRLDTKEFLKQVEAEEKEMKRRQREALIESLVFLLKAVGAAVVFAAGLVGLVLLLL